MDKRAAKGAADRDSAPLRHFARQRLVDRDVVGVSVSDLPHTLLAPKDVRDAEGVRLRRNANYRVGDVFKPNEVSQVPTHVCSDNIEAVVGAV